MRTVLKQDRPHIRDEQTEPEKKTQGEKGHTYDGKNLVIEDRIAPCNFIKEEQWQVQG